MVTQNSWKTSYRGWRVYLWKRACPLLGLLSLKNDTSVVNVSCFVTHDWITPGCRKSTGWLPLRSLIIILLRSSDLPSPVSFYDKWNTRETSSCRRCYCCCRRRFDLYVAAVKILLNSRTEINCPRHRSYKVY